MNNEQRFELIQKLLPFYHQYRNTGVTKLEKEQTDNLKLIYWDIYKIKANTGCPVCCSHYLSMLFTWYDREYNLWLSQQPVEQIEEPPAVEEPPIIKKKRTPRNNSQKQ